MPTTWYAVPTRARRPREEFEEETHQWAEHEDAEHRSDAPGQTFTHPEVVEHERRDRHDRTVREVEDAGGLVGEDEAECRERIDRAECEADHDERHEVVQHCVPPLPTRKCCAMLPEAQDRSCLTPYNRFVGLDEESPLMTNLLKGRVAVVTGGGRGVGRAHSLLLAQRGARVVVCDVGAELDGRGRDRSVADSVVAEIRGAGGEAVADHSDISTFEGASRAGGACGGCVRTDRHRREQRGVGRGWRRWGRDDRDDHRGAARARLRGELRGDDRNDPCRVAALPHAGRVAS